MLTETPGVARRVILYTIVAADRFIENFRTRTVHVASVGQIHRRSADTVTHKHKIKMFFYVVTFLFLIVFI